MAKQKSSKHNPAVIEQSRLVHYEGPLPPPHVLEHLENIVPGAAERIFSMAEKEQQAHIKSVEDVNEIAKTSLTQSHKETMCSLLIAGAVCLCTLACGTYLTLQGFPKIGCLLLGGTLTALVSTFLRYRMVKLNK